MNGFSSLLLCLLAGGILTPPERDLHSEWERLTHASATERAAAERWLTAHLALADRADLEDLLATAGAEAQGRLIEALAADERNLGLAAELAASVRATSARTGRAALIEAITRWSPLAHEPGLVGRDLFSAMNEWTGPRLEIDMLLATSPLVDVLDLMARAVPTRMGIVVDPRVNGQRSSGTQAPIGGSFASVLRELGARHELGLVGYGCDEDAPEGTPRWLVLVPSAATEDAIDVEDAATRLAEWATIVAGPGGIGARSAAAQALAASEWPAAVRFMAERWSSQRDPAAFEGVLLAARRGRAAPQLINAAGQRALREALDEALRAQPSDDRVPVRLALALGATGIRSPEGEDLMRAALVELAALNGRALHARLVEIDGRGATDEATRTALDAVLERDDVGIGSHLLALELRARCVAPITIVRRARESVEDSARRGRLRDLAHILRDAGQFPPTEWRDPGQVPADWNASMRAFVAEAWFTRGELDVGADHVNFALISADEGARERLAAALRDITRDAADAAAGPWCARILERAGVRRRLAARLVVLAGVTCAAASAEALADEVLATIATPPITREDLLLLAALVAGPRGTPARERLLQSPGSGADFDDVLAALELALSELRARRDLDAERAFVSDTRAVARRLPPAERVRLSVGVWPAPAWREPLRLADWDRSWSRFGK